MSLMDLYLDWKARRRCKRELRALEKHYRPKIEKLNGDDRAAEISSYFYERGPFDAELDYLDSKGVLKSARKLGIGVPKGDDWWDHNDFFEHRFLTEMGRAKLRRQIQAEVWESRKHWIEFITAITGLVGTAIGLVALFKHGG